jgi:hypothetical protein
MTGKGTVGDVGRLASAQEMGRQEIEWRLSLAKDRLHRITPPRTRAELFEGDMLREDVRILEQALAPTGAGE